MFLIKNKEEGGLKVPSFKYIVDSVKLKCFLQIFDSDSEQVWALLVRQYFKTNNLDLSAAIKCPELSRGEWGMSAPWGYPPHHVYRTRVLPGEYYFSEDDAPTIRHHFPRHDTHPGVSVFAEVNTTS